MNIIKHILVTFLLLITLALTAQQVSFTAQAHQNVALGQRFNITYSLNRQGTGFKGPQITGFNVLSGPNQSSSTSVQIVNGQMTQNVSLTYTYIVQAAKEGTFTIPAASITVDGTEYKSNELNITVAGGTAPQNQTQQQQTNTESQTASGNEIFLKAYVDKTNPIQGQQIIVTYKIYTSLPVAQYTIDKFSSFNGFWSENLLEENVKPHQTSEVINGVNYTVAEIYKVALFPQRSGNLTIDPLSVDAVVQKRTQRQRQNIFDDFFNPFGNVQNVQMTIKSKPITVNVKPLPSHNRTADFKGSVGSFTMTADIDKTELSINEAATLKVKITGKGNIKLIEDLPINFPPNLETYPPKVEDKINKTPSGVSGSRTFEYLIIPRSGGHFDISPVLFSFYDPDKNAYQNLSSDPFVLNVAKGDGSESGIPVNMVSREDVMYIGSDIRYIKSDVFPLNTIGYSFFASNSFLILGLIPLVLFILFLIIWRRQIKLNNNTAMLKSRKAGRLARNRMKQALTYMKTDKTGLFYDEVSQALWGYLSYKLNIPFSDLSKDTVKISFDELNVTDALADSFINVLDTCEYARFAPGDKQQTMDNVYKSAVDVITKIEKALK